MAHGIFSCSVQILSCGMWESSLTRDPTQSPLHWECGVLTTGLPGKSLQSLWFNPIEGAFSWKTWKHS